jgi:Protein of unknown function (DUF3551)
MRRTSSRPGLGIKHKGGHLKQGSHYEAAMRLLLFMLGILLGIACIEKPAETQNYPWCAGGTDCGFTTYQQCLDKVSGIGGFCEPNTQYQPRKDPLSRGKTRHPY